MKTLFVLLTRPELGPLLREREAHGFVLFRSVDRDGNTGELIPLRRRLRGYWFADLAEAWRHADEEARWRAARRQALNKRASERRRARAAELSTDRFVMARKAAAKAKAKAKRKPVRKPARKPVRAR